MSEGSGTFRQRFGPAVFLIVIAVLAGMVLGTFQVLEGAGAALRLDGYSPMTGLLVSGAGLLVVAVVTLGLAERHRSRAGLLGLVLAPVGVFGLAWTATTIALPMTWPVHRVAVATARVSWSGYEFVNGECYERVESERPWWVVVLTDRNWARLIVAPVSGDGVPGIALGDAVLAEVAESVFPIPGQMTYDTRDLVVSDVAADGSGRAEATAGSGSTSHVEWTCADWRPVRAPMDKVTPPARLTSGAP